MRYAVDKPSWHVILAVVLLLGNACAVTLFPLDPPFTMQIAASAPTPTKVRTATRRVRKTVRTPTPTFTPEPTATLTVYEQYPGLYQRYRDYEERILELRYKRALFAYMEQHTPWNLTLQDGGIELDAAAQIRAWPVVVVHSVPRGAWPLVIVSHPAAAGIHGTLLFNWRGGEWDWQALPYVDLFQVQAARYIPTSQAQELVVIYQDCAYCSATGAGFDLWRWNGQAWQQIWQMPYGTDAKSHGEVLLDDPSLTTIRLKYSSWNRLDPKNFFHESNPGPHRYFVETWARAGDGYRLVNTLTEPSAYNTLVEFTFAMNQRDDVSARRWTVDDAVIQKAHALGFENIEGFAYPPKGYDYPEHDGCSIWTIEQCDLWSITALTDSRPRDFTVRLVRRGTGWLIAEIDSRR